MNDKDRASLTRYLRECADLLDLRDWDVRLSDEACDDSADASVYCVRDVHVAHIQVSDDFRTLTSQRQRHVIAHEMAHIHMDADIDYLDSFMPALIGTHSWLPTRAALLTLHEQGIDRVAKGMEAALPLWKP